MAASELHAGIAEVDITPPLGRRMAGHFYEVLADDIHDPLKVKATVLRQGEQKLAFVSADVIGVTLDESSPARMLATAPGGLTLGKTMINATHSHTGPLFRDIRYDFFHDQAIGKHGRDPHALDDYPGFLAKKIVEALHLADSQLQPATLEVASARQAGVAFNRRYRMRDGTVQFNPGQLNPDIVGPVGMIDPEVSVLLLRSAETELALGSLTVFACHADTIGGTGYSADYPFFLEEQLKYAYGPEFVSSFAPGASGDINHIDVRKEGPIKGVEVAERIGHTLANTVVSALDKSTASDAPSLAIKRRMLEVPLQAVTDHDVARARKLLPLLNEKNGHFIDLVKAIKTLELGQKGPSHLLEVQTFRLDENTALVGLPSEIFTELGLAIKDASPFEQTIVTTMANDRLGYIPTAGAFQEGSYEVINSRVKPGVGELLAQTAIDLLRELREEK